MGFPFKVEKDRYEKIKNKMRYEKQVLLGTWYDSLFLPKTVDLKKYGYVVGTLPVAERLSDNRVLNLPTNIRTTEEDARRIVDAIVN